MLAIPDLASSQAASLILLDARRRSSVTARHCVRASALPMPKRWPGRASQPRCQEHRLVTPAGNRRTTVVPCPARASISIVAPCKAARRSAGRNRLACKARSGGAPSSDTVICTRPPTWAAASRTRPQGDCSMARETRSPRIWRKARGSVRTDEVGLHCQFQRNEPLCGEALELAASPLSSRNRHPAHRRRTSSGRVRSDRRQAASPAAAAVHAVVSSPPPRIPWRRSTRAALPAGRRPLRCPETL